MSHLRFFATLFFMTSMLCAHAQLADPREKFSITADVDGATNSDYYWKNDNGERGGRTSEARCGSASAS